MPVRDIRFAGQHLSPGLLHVVQDELHKFHCWLFLFIQRTVWLRLR